MITPCKVSANGLDGTGAGGVIRGPFTGEVPDVEIRGAEQPAIAKMATNALAQPLFRRIQHGELRFRSS
jgi:hypothetical protein